MNADQAWQRRTRRRLPMIVVGPRRRAREDEKINRRRAEWPVITGGSVEFSTQAETAKSENDAFVVLRGLQPKAPPL